jgi:hypothetical protein
MGKHLLGIMSIQDVTPQVAETKTWSKFATSSTKAEEVPFLRSLAG